MPALTKAQREALPADDFLRPDIRLLPVLTQDDVDEAVRLLPKAGGSSADRERLAAICKRKGLRPPPGLEAGFSLDAPFDTSTASTGDLTADVVHREAPLIFEEGEWDFPVDKGGPYAMSREDILAFCADFKAPVELEDTHAPSVFNGKLGHLVEVKPAADFSRFGGKVAVPRWLDTLFKGQPIPLSAKWDRATKRLTRLALVPKGRIDGAAMFAAFAEDVAAKKSAPKSTPHGRGALQMIHDTAARAGAACKEETATGGGTAVSYAAEFTAPAEKSALQKAHDAASAGGAECNLYHPEKDETGLQPMAAAYAATFGAPARVKASDREKALEAELARARAERDAERQAVAKEKSEAAFAAGMEKREAVIKGKLGAWFTAGRMFPYQRQAVEALLRAAAESGLRYGGEVSFADDGGSHVGDLFDAAVALFDQATPHGLTRERAADTGEGSATFRALTSGGAEPDNVRAARQAAEEWAAKHGNGNGRARPEEAKK